jgi:phosphatidylglycerol---prolipoprotein diacylglyceryl transferase
MIINIDPVICRIGFIQLHWYGLMYLIGMAAAWSFGCFRIRQQSWRGWTCHQFADLIFYCALGVVIGGRLGYLLFYGWARLSQDPWFLFRLWEGGMSFHGGFLGVLIAAGIYGKQHHRSFVAIMDFIAPLAPLGLLFGRLGNFINGELWGKPTEMPWGMIFPNGGMVSRHPTQLYELFLEGLVMFFILWIYSYRERPRYAVSGLFLMSYGCFRSLIEFWRIPDEQLGYLAWDWLTMGQLLSIPMIVVGAGMIRFAYWRARRIYS